MRPLQQREVGGERSHFVVARPFISCCFEKPLRYSEDIDLVQTQGEPIGTTIDAITRCALMAREMQHESRSPIDALEYSDSLPKSKAAANSSSRWRSTHVNTRICMASKSYPFEVTAAGIRRKRNSLLRAGGNFRDQVRALLQRHKNRDLFDLNQGLLQLALDRDRVIACLEHYLALEGLRSAGRTRRSAC